MKKYKNWSTETKTNTIALLVYLCFVAAVFYFCS